MTAKPEQIIKDWALSFRDRFKKEVFYVNYSHGHQDGSFWYNLDCEKLVGSICYWPPGTLEIQFNHYETGTVVMQETIELDGSNALEKNLALLSKRVEKLLASEST